MITLQTQDHDQREQKNEKKTTIKNYKLRVTTEHIKFDDKEMS